MKVVASQKSESLVLLESHALAAKGESDEE